MTLVEEQAVIGVLPQQRQQIEEGKAALRGGGRHALLRDIVEEVRKDLERHGERHDRHGKPVTLRQGRQAVELDGQCIPPVVTPGRPPVVAGQRHEPFELLWIPVPIHLLKLPHPGESLDTLPAHPPVQLHGPINALGQQAVAEQPAGVLHLRRKAPRRAAVIEVVLHHDDIRAERQSHLFEDIDLLLETDVAHTPVDHPNRAPGEFRRQVPLGLLDVDLVGLEIVAPGDRVADDQDTALAGRFLARDLGIAQAEAVDVHEHVFTRQVVVADDDTRVGHEPFPACGLAHQQVRVVLDRPPVARHDVRRTHAQHHLGGAEHARHQQPGQHDAAGAPPTARRFVRLPDVAHGAWVGARTPSSS